jgi:hypothetical protein
LRHHHGGRPWGTPPFAIGRKAYHGVFNILSEPRGVATGGVRARRSTVRRCTIRSVPTRRRHACRTALTRSATQAGLVPRRPDLASVPR